MNDNKPTDETAEHNETEAQKHERAAKAIKHRVALLMDELKSCWLPEMRLTFIARSTEDSTRYTLLTEETDFLEFLKWLNTAKPLFGNAAASNAVN